MSEAATFTTKAQQLLVKLASKVPKGHPLQVLLYSDRHNINISYSNMTVDQPFHIASVGKLCTAVLIGILQDERRISIDAPVTDFVTADMLQGLFVYKGEDFSGRVTLRHLLSHTSGVADYFESKVTADAPFVDQLLREPDKRWTPQELLDFTRRNQSMIGPLGTFCYSDTGYILLGMIIESVTKISFSEALDQYIFRPLDMNDSYLLFYGQPVNVYRPIAPIFFNDIEISTKKLLSCDWAGGGIVATAHDLLRFQQALWSGTLVSLEYVQAMANIAHKFRGGMHYGMGMMELRFNEFFFLLRGLPKPKGHSGILATHAYYDATNDLHIIVNYGSNRRMAQSIKALIAIEQLTKRYIPRDPIVKM